MEHEDPSILIMALLKFLSHDSLRTLTFIRSEDPNANGALVIARFHWRSAGEQYIWNPDYLTYIVI